MASKEGTAPAPATAPKKTGFLERVVPISNEFYDKKKDHYLVAPKPRILKFLAFLRVIQFGVFLAMGLYYALPTGYVYDERIETVWNYKPEYYNCTPMRADPYWGWKLNYQECKANVRPPSNETIVSVPNGGGWAYKPFNFTDKYFGVSTRAWAPGDVYATQFVADAARLNFSNHVKSLNGRSSDAHLSTKMLSGAPWNITRDVTSVWVPNVPASTVPTRSHSETCIDYSQTCILNSTYTNCTRTVKDFANDGYRWCSGDSCDRPNATVDTSALCAAVPYPYNYSYGDWVENYDCRNFPEYSIEDLTHVESCYFNHSHPLLRKLVAYVGLPESSPTVPGSRQLPIMDGYERGKAFVQQEILFDEAASMFQAAFDADLVCQYTKSSAPYTCNGKIPRSPLVIASLAFSNALLMYTVFSSIAVAVFKKTSSKPESAAPTAQKTSIWEKLVPITEKFYNMNKEEDLVASKGKIIPFIILLRIIQILGFGALLGYYASPAGYVSDQRIVSVWNYKPEYYNCTPMLADAYWAWTFNYDTCKAYVQPPSDATIFDLPDNRGWVYRPFNFTGTNAGFTPNTFRQGGVYSSVGDANHARYVFEDNLRSSNEASFLGGFPREVAEWIVPNVTFPRWIQGSESGAQPVQKNSHATMCWNYTSPTPGFRMRHDPTPDVCSANSCTRTNASNAWQGACQKWGEYEDWNKYCRDDFGDDNLDELFHIDSCYWNHSHPLMRDFYVACGLPADKTDGLPQTCNGETLYVQPVDFGSHYKRGARFEVKGINRTTAEQMFRLWYDGDHVCAYAKASPPYVCDGKIPRPPLEIMSLAFSNCLLLYSIFSIICVNLFLKGSGKK